MITALATQEDLVGFKNALERLSLNLDYHVNSSLSQAHAISLVRGPADDGNGNDLRIFQDANGHAVSGTNPAQANFIRFVINGVLYYAPCLYTDPGAQDATTGKVELTPPVVDRPTNTALLTDFITFQAQAALRTNDALLSHVGKRHQTAHVAMTAVPTVTTAPDGHAYANYLIRFQFNNKLYSIPCHTRLGGPAQPVRGANLLSDVPKKYNSWSSSHDDRQKADFTLVTPTAGTRPYTVVYEINSKIPLWDKNTKVVTLTSSVWNEMTEESAGWHVADIDNEVEYDISISNILQFRVTSGSDDSKPQLVARAKISNEAGIVYSNYVFMRSNDEDGGLFSGPDSSRKAFLATITGSPPIQ